MDVVQLVDKARQSSRATLMEIANLPADITADNVEDYIAGLVSLASRLSVDADLLKSSAAHVFAYRDAPKRARALEKCDDVLKRLDVVRDIIASSIEGDDGVECSETDAAQIDDALRLMTEFVEDAERFATLKETRFAR